MIGKNKFIQMITKTNKKIGENLLQTQIQKNGSNNLDLNEMTILTFMWKKQQF